ncbi:MFS transporter [Jeotgalibacillus proteolyticus]|uniref:MFS transporter n=1 Tax=Jeotgalibacillus proteolyticus TaxID=2082395 RepID=A0A2S5GH26_9BACL|nr:MFS transporter [Jeotgalibacillus proteolyticus]PPA72224.1 MFS transporter [Jeotgalibacillus proteolyticus]
MSINSRTATQPPRSGWQLYFSLPILSWALYDFANTIFSSNINTIFFPFYLDAVIGTNAEMSQVASTFISYANALASFFLVVFSPLYGVWIDRTGQKKSYIVWFTAISIAATFLMGAFALANNNQEWFGLPAVLFLVVIMFVIAKFFFNSSLVFYDTMLSDLGSKEEIPLISGYGVAVGYLGTVVGLSVYLFVQEGSPEQAFIPTAALYLIFSLPLFFFLKDPPKKQTQKKSFLSGYKEIYTTFKEMRQYKNIFTFMAAYFFLNDAIATTIAIMAIYATAVVGFNGGQFIILYLGSTIAAIIGSFIFGYITKKIGSKKAIIAVAIILITALTIAAAAVAQWMFWIAGSLIGIALGSMWVTSRTLIVELTPEEKRGQFFGLFAFSGKVSSIIGPLVYGTITLTLREYGEFASRVAISSLIVMALIGLIILFKVKSPQRAY